MKIRSSKDKTEHILVRVTPYAAFGEQDEFNQFEFLYFNYSSSIEDQIVAFHNNWKNRTCRIQRYPIELRETILIDSSLIENADNMESEDFKYIKFDSLNHLEGEPVFNECDKHYKIRGTLLCDLHHFEIQVERIPDGDLVPSVIFLARAYYSDLTDTILSKIYFIDPTPSNLNSSIYY